LSLRGTWEHRNGEDCITISFVICTAHQISFNRSNQEELDGRGMWHVRETGEVRAEFWWGNLRERRGVDGRVVLE